MYNLLTYHIKSLFYIIYNERRVCMKHKKLASLIALLGVMSISVTSYVFAQDGFVNPFSENKEREQQVIEAIINGTELPPENEDFLYAVPEISPTWVCVDCSWFMPSVCFKDGRVEGVGTHQYGLLNDKTCTHTILYSRAAYICPTCGRQDPIEGEHWCWDVHRDCGQGQCDLCPMDDT